MNSATATKFRESFNEAMKKLEEEFGGEIKLGSITYSEDGLSSKINFKETPKDGKTIEQTEFESVCHLFDLEPKHYQSKFIVGGDEFTLTALKTRSPKWPVIGENNQGQSFKFRETALLQIKGS